MNIFNNKKVMLSLITLQEAFTAMLPFFLLSSFITLFYLMAKYFQFSFINLAELHKLNVAFSMFSSVVATIAISYFMAIRFKISAIISVILSIATYITILWINTGNIQPEQGFSIITILNPIISTFLLKYLYPRFSINIPVADGNVHIYRLFSYLSVFIVAYFCMLGLYIVLEYSLLKVLVYLKTISLDLPNIVILAIRDFLVQVFWFFGVHGEHMVNGIFGKEILFENIVPNLTYGEFHRMFVNIGGAGIGMSILVALLLYAKDNGIRFITKLSIPFAIFNIDSLLIYAVVVLNRYLLIPFLVLPIFNLIVAYIALHLVSVNFTDYYVIWNTPVFIDSYLKTDGNLFVLFLQAFLLVIDILVYSYFIVKFVNVRAITRHISSLKDSLDITDEIQSKESVYAFKAYRDLINANSKLDEIIHSLNKDNLFVYYQPKVDIKHNKCEKFESLIRYRHEGVLKGPIFLDIIEKAGLAPIVDIWVSKEVKKSIDEWKKENFYPNISVNLHPDTLKSTDAIHKVVEIFEGENITFEIIERSFVYKEAKENLKFLQSKGFKISIDDFGTGYSSLETIINYHIDELKIDKSLIDVIDTKKGYLVCKHSAELCHDIGCLVVAEGVETKEQIKIVKEINIDIVQGYYFSKAIPFDEVKEFSKKFSNEKN